MGCNYLPLPEIPTSSAKVLICDYVSLSLSQIGWVEKGPRMPNWSKLGRRCLTTLFRRRSSTMTHKRYDGRVESGLALSQWETSFQSNAVSHWLGANLESALYKWCCSLYGIQTVFSVCAISSLMTVKQKDRFNEWCETAQMNTYNAEFQSNIKYHANDYTYI